MRSDAFEGIGAWSHVPPAARTRAPRPFVGVTGTHHRILGGSSVRTPGPSWLALSGLAAPSPYRIQFGDIQETALVTLTIRARETARPNPRIKDEKAAEIIDAPGVDVSSYDPFLSHEGVVARTIMFADALRVLVERYPDALCVNLGCGFDDKLGQVDDGTIEWFDVGLPDQIAVRRKAFEDRPRCTMPEGDALDGARTQRLPKGRSTAVVVMEGVLEYFTKGQTAACLRMFCDSFEHGWLVAEMNSMLIVRHSRQHGAIKNTNASFRWGTDSGEEFVGLEPRLRLVSEQSYNVEMRRRTLRGSCSPPRSAGTRTTAWQCSRGEGVWREMGSSLAALPGISFSYKSYKLLTF